MKEVGPSEVRQTPVITGDPKISWRPAHSDVCLTKSEGRPLGGGVSGGRNRRPLTQGNGFGHDRCRTAGKRSRLRHRTQQGSKHLRSEEHTSELQSPCNLVCRLL